MEYKYFIAYPDFRVDEMYTDDIMEVESQALVVYGTTCELKYKDCTAYFSKTRTGKENLSVGNFGAHGVLILSTKNDSDLEKKISEHFRRLLSDDYYRLSFVDSIEHVRNLEVFCDYLEIVIGAPPYKRDTQGAASVDKKDQRANELRMGNTIRGAIRDIAQLIRKYLKDNNMLERTIIVFDGEGYIRHKDVSLGKQLGMPYEAKDKDDEPKEFGMIVSLPREAAGKICMEDIPLIGVKMQHFHIAYEPLDETTWCFYRTGLLNGETSGATKLRGILLEPRKEAQIVEVDGDFKSMQSLVGGEVGEFTFFNRTLLVVYNKDGLMAGLPDTAMIHSKDDGLTHCLNGTVFILGTDGYDAKSLTEEQCEQCLKIFPDKYHSYLE
ncbi:hypothetical protein B5F10_02055 [Anaerotruncus colihominis]|uniref:DUF3846 domain-containing protein n=1 Tax=Anaerotruncus colihominis TaxID=169435 RepID=A0A1Y4N5W9_9FIRM|nr:DUF3846 domain-containing protein [Anaerotruncus colihominis]OUP70724.1 hypothetical protein B5F11_04565 [Anaerotruncus colihominis]OUP75940.1 hypothetical protein B5F10_02055 [Anaerotruncus colihominis]